MKVAFQKNDQNLFAGLIRLWTRSEYSHCELIFSDDMMFSSHLADNGTRFVRPFILNPNYWDILHVPMTTDCEKIVRNWCEGELYCRYDWWGIWFSQIIKLQREHPSKWFCSEICAAALQRVAMLDGAKACTFSPGKLYKRLKESGATTCVQ